MKPQTLVRNKLTGELGVIVRSDWGHDVPGSVHAVFDGNTYSQEIMPEDLEVIGPENAIADFEKCGGGKGKDCCIFLTMDSSGFTCDRFSGLRTSIQFKKTSMVSKREPSELYPACQLQNMEEE